MADSDTKQEVERLKRENAELSGMVLATGVILTQLLQSMLKAELNPQAGATRALTNARDAIEDFTKQSGSDPVMRERALEALKQYEDQIRSVLTV